MMKYIRLPRPGLRIALLALTGCALVLGSFVVSSPARAEIRIERAESSPARLDTTHSFKATATRVQFARMQSDGPRHGPRPVRKPISGIATGDTYPQTQIADPLEPVNRLFFQFNRGFDFVVTRPVIQTYRLFMPEPARRGVTNFLRNLRSPLTLANEILQGDFKGATTAVTRFAVNSTLGFGGVYDAAANDFDMPFEREDFGQTLGVWGASHGFYLVLPVVGPSSLRETTGRVAEVFADPINIALDNSDDEGWIYARSGAEYLSAREIFWEQQQSLLQSSVDPYAAIRSSYAQYQAAIVRDQDPDLLDTQASIPDFEDSEFAGR